jgi:hypothetical protein
MIALKQRNNSGQLRAAALSRRACRAGLYPVCGSSVLGIQRWQDGCLITIRKRVAFLARNLGFSGVINRDCFGARGGELERIGGPRLPSRRQIGSLALASTSFAKPAEISLRTTFCAAPPLSVGGATASV